MGDILRFGGRLCLIVFHGTGQQKPSQTRSKVSMHSALTAVGTRVNACGPLSTTACILVNVQILLQRS